MNPIIPAGGGDEVAESQAAAMASNANRYNSSYGAALSARKWATFSPLLARHCWTPPTSPQVVTVTSPNEMVTPPAYAETRA